MGEESLDGSSGGGQRQKLASEDSDSWKLSFFLLPPLQRALADVDELLMANLQKPVELRGLLLLFPVGKGLSPLETEPLRDTGLLVDNGSSVKKKKAKRNEEG